MKIKPFIIILSLCSTFAACKKGEKQLTPLSTEKRTVKFNIADFQISTEGLKTAGVTHAASIDTLRKHIKFLELNIRNQDDFSSAGYMLQNADDPNFGQLSAELPPGDYTADIVGAGDNIFLETIRSLIIFTAPGSDTFAQKVNFSVGGESVTKDVELKRVCAKLRLKFAGKLPPNAGGFSITPIKQYFDGNESDYWFSIVSVSSPDNFGLTTWAVDGYSVNYNFSDEDRNNAQFRYNMYVPSDANPYQLDLLLRIYDKQRATIISKQLYEVPIEKNKVTTLVNDPSNSNGNFSITLDGTWDSETNDVTF